MRPASAAPWRVVVVTTVFAASVTLASLGPAIWIAVALGGGVVTWRVLDRRRLTLLLVALACLAGSGRGALAAAADSGPGSVAGHIGTGSVVLRGRIADSGVPGRDDTLVVAVSELAGALGTWRAAGAVVVQPLTPVDVLPGDEVEVQTPGLRAPAQRPGSLSAVALDRVGARAIAPAAQVAVLSRGGPSPARLAQMLRRRLVAAVGRQLPEPEATLLLGIAFGIHGTLSGAVRTPLQQSGLIHIVAVSGLKVVMVAGMVQAVARLRHWSPRRRAVSTLLVLVLYLVLGGAGAAALRSTLTVAAGLVLRRDGRRPHSLALLTVCAAVLLAVDPAIATDVGFQLSFLGTAGILLLAAPIAARVPGPRMLAEPFAVTVAAQLATAPVTAGTFGVLSLVGPFANALVLPLLPLCIALGGAGALSAALLPTVGPAFAWAPLAAAALVTRVVLAIASGCAALPLASLQIGLWPWTWTLVEAASAVAAAVTWRMLRRDGWRPLTATALGTATAAATGVIAVATASAAVPAPFRVVVLDVGNGTAVLVRPPAGGTVLVDGGADGAALLTALGRVMSPLDRHLDAVVLTATDRATAAAIGGLRGRFDVGTLFVSQPLPNALQVIATSLAGAGTHVVNAGPASWSIGALRARCLPSDPAPSAPCLLQLSDGRATAIVTGNLAAAAQDEVAAVEGPRLRADLLVGPTTTAPDTALLEAVRPSALAIPARRQPPGLGAVTAAIAVTGRDSDLQFDAAPAGGFMPPGG